MPPPPSARARSPPTRPPTPPPPHPPPPRPPPPAPPRRARGPPGTRVASTKRTQRALQIGGLLHPAAPGTITVALSARRGRRRISAHATATARDGAFHTRLRLPKRARRATRAT